MCIICSAEAGGADSRQSKSKNRLSEFNLLDNSIPCLHMQGGDKHSGPGPIYMHGITRFYVFTFKRRSISLPTKYTHKRYANIMFDRDQFLLYNSHCLPHSVPPYMWISFLCYQKVIYCPISCLSSRYRPVYMGHLLSYLLDIINY